MHSCGGCEWLTDGQELSLFHPKPNLFLCKPQMSTNPHNLQKSKKNPLKLQKPLKSKSPPSKHLKRQFGAVSQLIMHIFTTRCFHTFNDSIFDGAYGWNWPDRKQCNYNTMRCSQILTKPMAKQQKVLQRSSAAASWARALWAERGCCTQIRRAIGSLREAGLTS